MSATSTWTVRKVECFPGWERQRRRKWCVCLDRIPRWPCRTFTEAFTHVRTMNDLNIRLTDEPGDKQ